MPTSSAQAGCALDPGNAEAGVAPPACAMAAPGSRPASRLARKLLNGKLRDSPLRLFRPDTTLACASPDRLLKAAAGAPSGKVSTYWYSGLLPDRLSRAWAVERWFDVDAASAKRIGRVCGCSGVSGVSGVVGTRLRSRLNVTAWLS
ncbi:hypothetical protein D3C85_1279870 [compost metagenome]